MPPLLLGRKVPVRRPPGRPRKQERVTSEKAPEARVELFGVAEREVALLGRASTDHLWWIAPARHRWHNP